LGRYYDNPNYISHDAERKSAFAKTYNLFKTIALQLKHRWIAKYVSPGELLDYGSGTGEFLDFMRSKGWKVKGVEWAADVRDKAASKYELELYAPDQLKAVPDESLDLITMWHVLEHLPDLRQTFEKVLTKLKSGGVLVLALPNPESYDAKHYKNFWAAWDVPIHFYHFRKKDVQMLADLHKLNLVAIRNMPFDAFYVSLLSEEYQKGSKKWLSAFFNGLKSNYKGRNSNASSLAYILRKQ
jgi:2-polyprenyl-3-methyl-5-hydroxy-6-metoxy-1,4-benzoquinol methylase